MLCRWYARVDSGRAMHAAAAASGEYAACLRLKRSFSAPHISHCMGQYARHSCLHMLPVYLRCQCCSAASVFTCESHGPRARALSAPVTVFTVRGTGTPSPSQLCARVRVSHGLSFRAALMPSSVTIYSLSPSQTGLLSLHLCVYSPSPSQAGLLSRCCVYSPKDSESVTLAARVRVRLELGCTVAAEAFLSYVQCIYSRSTPRTLSTFFFLHALGTFSVYLAVQPRTRAKSLPARARCASRIHTIVLG